MTVPFGHPEDDFTEGSVIEKNVICNSKVTL